MSLPMEQSLKIALDNTQTHACEFTRAYWIGYVRAKLQDGESCWIWLPEAHFHDIVTVAERCGSPAIHIERLEELRNAGQALRIMRIFVQAPVWAEAEAA